MRLAIERRGLLGAPVAAVAAAIALAAVVAACGSARPTVRQSCERRDLWLNGTTQACLVCLADAARARCDCDTSPVAGACAAQAGAVSRAPDCSGTAQCASTCAGDCACEDACYAAHEACRPLAADLDACVAQVCDERCR